MATQSPSKVDIFNSFLQSRNENFIVRRRSLKIELEMLMTITKQKERSSIVFRIPNDLLFGISNYLRFNHFIGFVHLKNDVPITMQPDTLYDSEAFLRYSSI